MKLSVVCLYSLGRLNEAILFINQVINENNQQEYKANLYILRARIFIKNYNVKKHDITQSFRIS